MRGNKNPRETPGEEIESHESQECTSRAIPPAGFEQAASHFFLVFDPFVASALSFIDIGFGVGVSFGISISVGFGICRLARARLATARGRDRQVHLVLPLTRPELARPPLQRDRANRRAIFVANHFAPRSRIRGPNLRRAFANTQQPLAIGSQTCHGSPILSTTRSTAHRCSSPPGACVLRPPCPEFSWQRGTGSWSCGKLSQFHSIASELHII